jgi:hypothetical protein
LAARGFLGPADDGFLVAAAFFFGDLASVTTAGATAAESDIVLPFLALTNFVQTTTNECIE